MNILKEFFYILWYKDFSVLSNWGDAVIVIYLLSFSILFLENGFIFASFLPGDTLLIFLGMLMAKDILNFPFTLVILTIAASLGSWFSYLQGRWLEDSALIKRYIVYLPKKYYCFSCKIFHSYGMFALFISRFIVFVRTLLPIMAGLSRLNSLRFHFFNWMSAFFWIFMLTLLGFILGKIELIQKYDQICYLMLFFIIVLLVIAIIGYVRKILLKNNHL